MATAYFYRHELDAFLAESERAISLNPNSVDTLAWMGLFLDQLGDERGIVLVRRAMKLDPFHPPWYYFTISGYHFSRGEYEEAVSAARRIEIPGYFWPQVYLAVSYTELGRQNEASSALGELLRLYPGFSVQTYVEEARKWNFQDDTIRRWAEALRKAGLPE